VFKVFDTDFNTEVFRQNYLLIADGVNNENIFRTIMMNIGIIDITDP